MWPTEETLRREGLLFDEGGTHSRKMVDVIDTLNRLKEEPSANFSSKDNSKLCRKLSELLMESDRYMLKLFHLKGLHEALRLLLDSAADTIFDQADENNISESDDFRPSINGRMIIHGAHQQLLSAVCDANEALFRRLAAEVPSKPAESLRRADELLSKITSLRQQISAAEDDLFRALEQHLQEPSHPCTAPEALL